MKHLLKGIAFALVLAAGTACSTHWGNFKKISMQAPADKTAMGPRVTGSDCTMRYWYTQNIANATRDALSKAPGATGLKDVVIKAKSWQWIFVNCIEVEGTPVK